MLIKRKRKKENKESLFCCEKCDYKSKRKITLTKHINTKHGLSEKEEKKKERKEERKEDRKEERKEVKVDLVAPTKEKGEKRRQ